MPSYDQPSHDFSCNCPECVGDYPEALRESPYARHVREADERRDLGIRGVCLACGRYYRGIHLEHLMCKCLGGPKGVPPYCYDHNCKKPCFICTAHAKGVNPWSLEGILGR